MLDVSPIMFAICWTIVEGVFVCFGILVVTVGQSFWLSRQAIEVSTQKHRHDVELKEKSRNEKHVRTPLNNLIVHYAYYDD